MIGAAANLCVAGECNTVKVAVARILWRDAQGIEGSIDLGATEVKIGRATECEIRTDDAMVSRNHARIAWGGGGYVVEDLQSANGVYFQEQRVASHLLKHGDAVRCGSLWLRFVDLASEMPRAAPQPLAAYHPGNTSATSGPSASPAPAVGGVGAPSDAGERRGQGFGLQCVGRDEFDARPLAGLEHLDVARGRADALPGRDEGRHQVTANVAAGAEHEAQAIVWRVGHVRSERWAVGDRYRIASPVRVRASRGNVVRGSG